MSWKIVCNKLHWKIITLSTFLTRITFFSFSLVQSESMAKEVIDSKYSANCKMKKIKK